MEDPSKIITHEGIITGIDDDTIRVSILARSACAHCQVKGMCSVADMKEKVIEVERNGHKDYKKGDQVEVMMYRKLGSKAVFLGYFLPFLILLTTLIISGIFIENELIAGLLALIVLVPYYAGLYFRKDKLKRTFSFRIR